jgi:hypothetical protein
VSLFKRRKTEAVPAGTEREASADDDVVDDAVVDDDVVDAAQGEPTDDTGVLVTDELGGAGTADGSGPYDVDDAPDEPRIELGALQLPLVEGAEVQLQVDEGSGLVTAAMVVLGDSAVQLQAFAAPRSEGIWDEVRDEIAAGISQQGGTADVSDGPFGRELLGRVPAQMPDGKVGFQPMRFVGVDGPRWLLRAVFHGRSAIEPVAAEPLEHLVRHVVVVRGADPMGPRELLALQLPEGATRIDPEAGEEQPEQPTSADDLNPFERGPEITEIH